MGRLTRKTGLILIATTTGATALTAGVFTTIPITATYDPLNRLSSNLYSVPYSGDYLIFSKVRLNDNTPITSYGQGVHTSNADGTWFAWSDTNTGSTGKRNGSQNFRAMSLNVGDLLRLYCYSDTNVTVGGAELNIIAL